MLRTLARTSLRSTRSLSVRATPVAARSAIASTIPRATFTSSAFTRSTPTPLSLKLQEEISFEQENAESEEPAFLQDFKKDGVWKIEDTPGADEVVLTRTWENESIRLLFSISDLDAGDVEPESFDEAEADGAVAEPTESEGAEEEGEASFPVEATITVTKSNGGGALTIDAVAQDGLFSISNISFYNDAKLANGLTAEDDWKRQGLYIGPDFQNLDEAVQTEFENYLEERGINSDLALFIPDFAEYKEQKEYLTWLTSVKKFVEA
ncbi:hypothetical protein P7C70_g6100, partial [Phenoliferia sp. Uapishka_3]